MRKGYAQTARMRSTSADAAFAVQATGGALTREQYEAQYSCATRLQTLQYLIFFYTSDVTANIGTRLGFTTLPRFMAERLIADLAAQIYCISSPTSTFSALALAQLGPTQLVLPITQSLSRVMAPYFDTFATVDDTVRWSVRARRRAAPGACARWPCIARALGTRPRARRARGLARQDAPARDAHHRSSPHPPRYLCRAGRGVCAR